MTKKDHKAMQTCLDNGIRIFSNQKRQIKIEKDGRVVKIYNVPRRENVSKKIISAYHYYLESL